MDTQTELQSEIQTIYDALDDDRKQELADLAARLMAEQQDQ